jgi:hypothetical protein
MCSRLSRTDHYDMQGQYHSLFGAVASKRPGGPLDRSLQGGDRVAGALGGGNRAGQAERGPVLDQRSSGPVEFLRLLRAGPTRTARAPSACRATKHRTAEGATEMMTQWAHRGGQPAHQESEAGRPWLPQLRQLPAAAAVALRRQVADSPNRETARPLTTLGGVEPV